MPSSRTPSQMHVKQLVDSSRTAPGAGRTGLAARRPRGPLARRNGRPARLRKPAAEGGIRGMGGGVGTDELVTRRTAARRPLPLPPPSPSLPPASSSRRPPPREAGPSGKAGPTAARSRTRWVATGARGPERGGRRGGGGGGGSGGRGGGGGRAAGSGTGREAGASPSPRAAGLEPPLPRPAGVRGNGSGQGRTGGGGAGPGRAEARERRGPGLGMG